MIASPYADDLARIPVREHHALVRGSDTAWWEYGPADAPVLVLVHGFRGDHHGLEPVVAQLPGFRIVSPDLPGFGESATFTARPHDIDAYAEWLGAFIRAIGIDGPYTLLGHSFGSIVAANAVARGLGAVDVGAVLADGDASELLVVGGGDHVPVILRRVA